MLNMRTLAVTDPVATVDDAGDIAAKSAPRASATTRRTLDAPTPLSG